MDLRIGFLEDWFGVEIYAIDFDVFELCVLGNVVYLELFFSSEDLEGFLYGQRNLDLSWCVQGITIVLSEKIELQLRRYFRGRFLYLKTEASPKMLKRFLHWNLNALFHIIDGAGIILSDVFAVFELSIASRLAILS